MADNHDVKITLEGMDDVSAILDELAKFASDPWMKRYLEEEMAEMDGPLFEIIRTGPQTLRLQARDCLFGLLSKLRERQAQH